MSVNGIKITQNFSSDGLLKHPHVMPFDFYSLGLLRIFFNNICCVYYQVTPYLCFQYYRVVTSAAKWKSCFSLLHADGHHFLHCISSGPAGLKTNCDNVPGDDKTKMTQGVWLWQWALKWKKDSDVLPQYTGQRLKPMLFTCCFERRGSNA